MSSLGDILAIGKQYLDRINARYETFVFNDIVRPFYLCHQTCMKVRWVPRAP